MAHFLRGIQEILEIPNSCKNSKMLGIPPGHPCSAGVSRTAPGDPSESPGLHLGYCHTKNLTRLNLTAVSKCWLKFFYMNRVHSYMLTNQHMISSSLGIMWSCVDLSLLFFFLTCQILISFIHIISKFLIHPNNFTRIIQHVFFSIFTPSYIIIYRCTQTAV